jgi:DNA-binding transcriptional ArsR family regulator
MAPKRARIVRRIWDSSSQRFAATGEVVEGDVSTLEQLADNLLGSSGLFLKGPVPWPWIVAAAALPGKALLVGLCLWRLSGAMKSRTVGLGNADLMHVGIDRAAKSRALSELERAGLVEVERKPGRFPSVTLTTAPSCPAEPTHRQRRTKKLV